MNEQPWRISHSDDVQKWYDKLSPDDKIRAKENFKRLRENGPQLREPHSKSLGQGLYELRFRCQNVNTRVTYHRHGQEFRTLTVFRKQRQNERNEVEKARLRMRQDRARLAERGDGERGSGGNNLGKSNKITQQDRSKSRQSRTDSNRRHDTRPKRTKGRGR